VLFSSCVCVWCWGCCSLPLCVCVCDLLIFLEVFERSRSKSSPLEKTRSKLANPVELTGFDRG